LPFHELQRPHILAREHLQPVDAAADVGKELARGVAGNFAARFLRGAFSLAVNMPFNVRAY
jgi:hypothetical protein